MLARAASRGWQPTGVDRSRFAAAVANTILPESTIACRAEQFRSERLFDVITCTDVIEHLRRPDFFLRAARSLLVPGGMLLVTTPNAGGVLSRLMGSSWLHIHREHLWYFSRRHLVALLRQSGFELLEWRVPRRRYTMRYLAGTVGAVARSAMVRAAARCCGLMPARLLDLPLPPLPEGQCAIARLGERT